MVKKVSLHNSLLGGAQIGIQLTLNILKQILLLAAPITGGLSLAPTAPIALAQAALAVYTTKITGRLAAHQFLIGTTRKDGKPGLMLNYLIKRNTDLRMIMGDFSFLESNSNKNKNFLLP